MSDPRHLAVDLYHDLRDRRLLPVAIGLVVAILAVPILLRSQAEAPPAAPAAIGVEDAAPAPAVMVEEEGIRDYRKRLDQLRSKNPFESKFAAPAVSEGVGLADVSETGSDGSTTVTIEDPASESSSSGGSGSTAVASTETSSSSVETDPDGGSGSSGGSNSSGGGSSSEKIVKEKEVRYAYRIDVNVGPKGAVSSRDGVKELTALPGDANPVVVFAGVTEDGKRAVFMVSSDVSETSGDGSCLPTARACRFLTLHKGDRRELTYATDGEESLTYVIELVAIDLVVVKK